MSDEYTQLLDATIQHLQGLKARGTRFVPVSEESLATLDRLLSGAPRPKAPLTSVRSNNLQAISAPAVEDKSLIPTIPARADSQPLVVRGTVPGDPKREAAFADLRKRALACVKCPHLASSRKNVVFGVGNIYAELMFVGEAPGADEDLQAEPFVGKAGQLLTKIIEAMGLRRDSVYIANILKCRPDTPGQAFGNRKPTPEEMQTCIPFLHEQIDLIKPKVLVGLGGTAIEGLLGKTGINKVRGAWQIYRGTPLMPTFHPAYLLRTPGDKRKVWEDMLLVMEKLGLPISDKQRNYFLKTG
jgi:DNA polymerase